MTDLQPGETRTYTAEIPQGETPKEIRMDIRTYDIWDDPLMNIIFWMAFIGFGWLIGWSLGVML